MIDRRQFLACSGLVAARLLVPWPARAAEAASTSCDAALDIARQHIITYCARLDFPNGALHTIRALGRRSPLGAGDPYRILLEDFLVERPVGDRMYLVAPIVKEGHRDALLMNLIEKDCELDLEFQIQGRRYVFRDLIESARMLLSYPGTLEIDEHAWTLFALSRTTPPDQATWKNAWGETIDLNRIMDDISALLESDTALIRQVDLSQDNVPFDCPVFARACGGMHMLHSYAVALAAGYATPARKAALAGHMRTAMRRLVYDMKVTDSIVKLNEQAVGAEAAAAVGFDARVKFLGHFIEVVAVVDKAKLYAFSPGERRELRAARAKLCDLLAGCRDMRFERHRNNKVLYDSMTTGLTHAYNALVQWPG